MEIIAALIGSFTLIFFYSLALFYCNLPDNESDAYPVIGFERSEVQISRGNLNGRCN